MRCPNLNELPPPAVEEHGWPWTEESARVSDTMAGSKSWPRISIVTPSYNQGKYLEETLRSVLLQGYPNLEYIVIDGGSADESVTIIRKYSPWLTYWVSERDQGQSDAINKGWSRCTGELIAWMNSDDYYLPNALHTAARAFTQNVAPEMVHGQTRMLDRRGRTSGARIYGASQEKMLANLVMPPQAAIFFKRTLLQTTGLLDTSLHYVMDFAFMLKVLANARQVAYVPSALAVFRYHPDSKTTTGEVEFARELLVVLDRIKSRWDEYPALHVLGATHVQSAFFRLVSKHLYLGNQFADSLHYIYLACRTYPAATFSILGNEGVRWFVRRILPLEHYRWLGSARHSSSMGQPKGPGDR